MIRTFDFRGVALDDGPLRRQFDEVRDFYLRIPNDDLLKGFRTWAGRPAPGSDLGGLYYRHGIFGQLLSGFARMYAATSDPACREKALALMYGWAECIDPAGIACPVGPEGLVPYNYDKLVGGLVDIHLYCSNNDALRYLSRITDWAEQNIAGVEKHINEKLANWFQANGEWYTLSENLYRAYIATKDPKYLRLAEQFEYTDFWNLVLSRADIFNRPEWPGWYHAYGHVNSFSGAGAAYLAKGDPYYLEVLEAAYEFIQGRTFATGGYGPDEILTPREELVELLKSSHHSFETQCGCWAAFKMSKYLITCTADAQYGDWVELLVINGIGASIPLAADGRVFYYSDYNLSGATKQTLSEDPGSPGTHANWPCCAGSRTQAVTDYHDLIYFTDERSLYVNLFASSTVRGRWDGQEVSVDQRTWFPEARTSELSVKVAGLAEFTISVRVPAWLAGPLKASINGEAVEVSADSLHWARFRRTWRNGDRLTIELPMEFHVSRIDPDREFPVAIMYGPVVLAARLTGGNPSSHFDLDRLSDTLVPVPGQSLNYHLASDQSVLLRPFYQYKKGEPYLLYLDPAQGNPGNQRDGPA